MNNYVHLYRKLEGDLLKRYLFISNSSKPTKEKAMSRDTISLGSVRRPCVETAHELGYEIWVGVNKEKPEELKADTDYPIYFYDSHTYRNILAFQDNYIAFHNAMRILKKGNFEVIHCNTPVGGIIGRLCGRLAKVPHVIYTVHGFHFYKGAPLFNRTVLKWAEMIMAHWTDVIITMNQEDYEAAKKFKLRNNGKVYYVPGVGIDTDVYKNIVVDRASIRSTLGLKDTDIVCISMGDLIPRKNYIAAIKAIAKCKNPNLHYLICGKGPELENLKMLVKKLSVENQIHFLGFRTDIKELLKTADIFLFTTLQEGMPRSMMEAMASGLPCIASKIRGNVDLLEDGKGGYLVQVDDVSVIAEKLQKLASDTELRKKMSERNIIRIKDFDTAKVIEIIGKIYREELG